MAKIGKMLGMQMTLLLVTEENMPFLIDMQLQRMTNTWQAF